MLGFPRLWRFTFFSERPITKSIPQGVATAVFCALVEPSLPAPGGYYANCAPVPDTDMYVSPLRMDREVCRRLWSLSEELTREGRRAEGS
jgi:hypothetical protein